MIYAQWSGTEGYGNQNSSKGYLLSPIGGHKIAIDQAVSHGLYPVTVTEPILTSTQTKDEMVWGFTGTEITLTWSVRDKTQDELDEETVTGVLDYQLYHVLKWLFNEGVITQTNIDNAPQALKDAWAARARLEA